MFEFRDSKPCPLRISLSEVMDMRRRSVLRTIRMKKPGPVTASLIILAVLFFLGGIAGDAYSKTCGEAAGDAFREYLSDYCLLYNQNRVNTSLIRCVVLYFGYICIAFLLGFSSLGVVLTPVLSAVFGFSSFYTVSCFAQTFGGTGVFLAASLIAIRLLFTLPSFFLVASEALPLSFRLAVLTAGRGKRIEPLFYNSRYFVLFAVCLAALCVGVCCERLLTPLLFRAAVGELEMFF